MADDAEPLSDWEREFLEKQAAEQQLVTAARHHRDHHPWLPSITDCAMPECARAVRGHIQAITESWPTITTTTTTRSITMDRKLTADDLVTYFVELTTAEGTQTRTVRAAYDTAEDGWLVLKDHEHRTVARFSAHIVLGVIRSEQPDGVPVSDEDRIRDAMAGARDHPGRTVTR